MHYKVVIIKHGTEMREKRLLSLCGELKHFWGRGVHSLLHCERKEWCSMIQAGNLEPKRSKGVQRGADASYVQRRRMNAVYC
jgi:hypothetical protein